MTRPCCPQSVWDPHTKTVVLQFSNDTATPKAKNGCDINEEILRGVLQTKSTETVVSLGGNI